jgi:hypothetical protein
MTMDESDPRTGLEKATEAVRDATEAVQTTTESIAGAIEDSRQPGGVLNEVTQLAREAPLRSLALAFLVGCIVACRSDWSP